MPPFLVFTDSSTTDIYTLSLHDALPISLHGGIVADQPFDFTVKVLFELAVILDPTNLLRIAFPNFQRGAARERCGADSRSEEHTSELQSHSDLVCRLLLEKKKRMSRYNK